MRCSQEKGYDTRSCVVPTRIVIKVLKHLVMLSEACQNARLCYGERHHLGLERPLSDQTRRELRETSTARYLMAGYHSSTLKTSRVSMARLRGYEQNVSGDRAHLGSIFGSMAAA